MALKLEQINYLKSLYLQGKTQREMQKATGYSIKTINKHCKAFSKQVDIEKKEIVIKHAELTGELIGQTTPVPQISVTTIDLIEERIQREMKGSEELTPAAAVLARSFMEFITKMKPKS